MIDWLKMTADRTDKERGHPSGTWERHGMATIRATCTDCGDVELRSADVSVRVCSHDDSAAYHFRCPSCRMIVVKPAEPRVIELLVATGVKLSTWSLPAELAEARHGPSITHDDLLDFHTLLDEDDWLDHVVRMTKG